MTTTLDLKELLETPRKTIEQLLREVDYEGIDFYSPSDFALNFVNFIKLIGHTENATPPIHFKMVDKMMTPAEGLDPEDVINLCFRGAAKSTVLEYLILYIATVEKIPGLGKVLHAIYVSDSMDNGVKKMRQALEMRWQNSDYLQQVLPKTKFTDARWYFENANGAIFVVNGYGAKTGIRGTRDNGSRPRLGLLDDLISDEDAESPTVIAKVEDVVSKAIEHAMHPTKRKVIWNGTPFNQRDPIYKAVESGAWRVNIFPVCEQFPCSREEFKGAWEDRFPYDAVLKSYIKAVRQGKLASFMQELMLRVMSDEEKVVLDSDIVFFDRSRVLSTASAYNCYITTDFATSDKKGADLSVIAVWFLDWNHRWLLVDGIARQQTMDKNINDLFKFVQRYRPMQVGIEVTGQQGGFIPWIEREMMQKQIYFTFASSNNSGAPGIRPTTNKMERFNVALPIIKQRKLCLPTEYMDMEIAREMKEELSYITPTGIHSRYDDCIDVISQIPLLDSYAPAGLNSSEYLDEVSSKQEVDYYSELDDHDPTELGGYSSYIV